MKKSDRIREYVAEHPDAKPVEIANALEKYDVAKGNVYQTLASMKKKKVKPKKGTPLVKRVPQASPLQACSEFVTSCGSFDSAQRFLDEARDFADALP